uniref:Uncharacterized protein n=1 Tax=Strongyloides venezuelensis TaxID=75913 RepID=A0A0K0FF97_STRVS
MRTVSLDIFFTRFLLFSILFSANFAKKKPSKPTLKPADVLQKELKHCLDDNKHLHEKIEEKREENNELIARNNKLTLLYQTCRKNRTKLEDYIQNNCSKQTTTITTTQQSTTKKATTKKATTKKASTKKTNKKKTKKQNKSGKKSSKGK